MLYDYKSICWLVCIVTFVFYVMVLLQTKCMRFCYRNGNHASNVKTIIKLSTTRPRRTSVIYLLWKKELHSKSVIFWWYCSRKPHEMITNLINGGSKIEGFQYFLSRKLQENRTNLIKAGFQEFVGNWPKCPQKSCGDTNY